MKIFYLVFILFQFAFFSCFAQHYHLQHLSTKNGLPSNATRSLLQDSKGNMWIGTDGGLVRYDGLNMTKFNKKDGLLGTRIFALYEDKNSVIWIGTYDNGLYYLKNNKIQKFPFHDSISKNIRVIEYDNQNSRLLIGTDDGLIIIKENKTQYIKSRDGKRNQIISINLLGNKTIINSYRDNATYELINDSLVDINEALPPKIGVVSNIFISSQQDTFYAYDRDSLLILNNIKKQSYTDVGHVFNIIEDEKGNVWVAGWDNTLIGNNGGLFRYRNNKLEDYTDVFSINTRSFWQLHFDTIEKSLWISTDEDGVYIYKENPFEYYDFSDNELEINDLLFHDGNLWVAERSNVFSLSKHNVVSQFDASVFDYSFRNIYYQIKKNNKSNDYDNLKVLSFGVNDNNELFVSTNTGFYRYNSTNKSFKGVGAIFNQFQFYNDKLYTIGWSQTQIISSSAPYFIDSLILKSEGKPVDVNDIIKHDNKLFYLSWNHGLYVQDGDDFNRLAKDKIDTYIKAISFDEKNHIFIVQNNGELVYANLYTDSIEILTSISELNGLHGMTINWVEYVKGIGLFVGTEKGLNYLSSDDLQNKNWYFKLYDSKEGYTAFLSSKSVVDSIGNIWLNTEHGVLKVNTSDFKNTTNYQNLILTGISLFNNRIDSVLDDEDLRLNHKQNSLTFYFHRNNYTNSSKDIYYYRLLGLNDEWKKSNNGNRVEFAYIPSGSYTFEVKCINENTLHESNITSYQFTILKPWWNTFAFYIIVFIIVIGIGWLSIRLRTNKLRKANEKQILITKKIAEVEMKALQSQMNPHFIFNTLNGIQNFVIKKETHNALEYIAVFSSLLRATIDYSSEKYITLEQEHAFLEDFLAIELMRYDNKFSCQFNFSKNIDKEEILIPPMLLQPIIENCTKHGEVHMIENGQIIIDFSLEDNTLKCSIADNGIGIKKAKLKANKTHKSKGIEILKERISLLSDNSKTGVQVIELKHGTQVVILLDLKRK